MLGNARNANWHYPIYSNFLCVIWKAYAESYRISTMIIYLCLKICYKVKDICWFLKSNNIRIWCRKSLAIKEASGGLTDDERDNNSDFFIQLLFNNLLRGRVILRMRWDYVTNKEQEQYKMFIILFIQCAHNLFIALINVALTLTPWSHYTLHFILSLFRITPAGLPYRRKKRAACSIDFVHIHNLFNTLSCTCVSTDMNIKTSPWTAEQCCESVRGTRPWQK